MSNRPDHRGAAPAVIAGVRFSVVLGVLTGFTLFFAVVWIVMLFAWPEPTSSQTSGIEALSHLAALGFGGLVGLVGGKLT